MDRNKTQAGRNMFIWPLPPKSIWVLLENIFNGNRTISWELEPF